MGRKKAKLWTTLIVVILANPVFGEIVYLRNGVTWNITWDIGDHVYVDYETYNIQTIVNWREGGITAKYYSGNLYGFNNSIINIYGGIITGHLAGYDNCKITVFGNSDEDTFAVYGYNNSQISLSNGLIDGLSITDNCTANIDGGNLKYSIQSYDNSIVSFSSGLVKDSLHAHGFSQITYTGGVVEDSLCLNDSAILTIYGSDFAIDGTPLDYGVLTSIFSNGYLNEPVRNLTGRLSNGDIINNDFYIGGNAKIILIPEPATILLLSIGTIIVRKF